MNTEILPLAGLNPYIIDLSNTTAHNLYYPLGMAYASRTVRCFEIELITGGSGAMIIAGKQFKTRRGDIIFRKPDMETQGIAGYYSCVIAFDPVYHQSRQNCYKCKIPYWLYDENTVVPDEGYFDHFPAHYNSTKLNELEPLFANIAQAFFNGKEMNQAYMKANLINIIDCINHEIGDTPDTLGKRAIHNNYEKILLCKEYIDKNLGDKLSLEMLADRSGLNRNLFCRKFRETLGCSPFEYIIENRMLLAQKLLTTTNICVEQISTICGFDDLSYFYRLFKRYFHTTPTFLREKFRNEAPETDKGNQKA